MSTVRVDREWARQIAELGAVPANDSSREHAAKVLGSLLTDLETLLGIVLRDAAADQQVLVVAAEERASTSSGRSSVAAVPPALSDRGVGDARLPVGPP